MGPGILLVFHYPPMGCWGQVSFDYSSHIPGGGKFEMGTFFLYVLYHGAMGHIFNYHYLRPQ